MEDVFTALETPEAILEAEEAERLAEIARLQAEEQQKRMIEKMHRRFRRAQTARQPKEKLWAEIDEFDRGEQWKRASIPPWVPKPVTNMIRMFRVLKRSNLASNIPRATFAPEYPEDTPLIQRLQKAYDHVWEWEKVPREVRRAIDRGIRIGTGVVMVYNDDNHWGGKYYEPQVEYDADGNEIEIPDPRNSLYQGKICVKKIPTENFFPDPDAYRIDDCKFIEYTELVALNTIKNTAAFQEYAGEKLANLRTSRPDTDDSSSGEIYNRDHMISDGSNGADEEDDMVTLHTHYERYLGEDNQWHLDVTYYIRNPDMILLRLEDVQPNEYPFAVFYYEEEEKDIWGTSDIMAGMLELQKIVNKVQQVAAVIGSLHQNPQKVVSREAGINPKELAKNGSIPGYTWSANGDPQRAIHVLEPPDIPRGLFDLDERTKNDMREISGLNEAYMGQSVGSLTTSTGVDSLIERATIRDKDIMIQIDEFVERISHLIVLNILHKWQDERPIPTTNPDGSVNHETWQPIDPITAKNLSWRVKSNVYAKAPTTQAGRRQQADKLLQLQGQYQFQPAVITPEEWIKMQDFEEGPAILQRMQADRERMQQQQQMDMVNTVMQLAMQVGEMVAQGAPTDMVAQQLMPMVQEMLAPQQQMGQPPSGQRPSAPSQPQLPKGATSEVAMANMARGSM